MCMQSIVTTICMYCIDSVLSFTKVLPELHPKRGGIRELFWRAPLVPRRTTCNLDAPPIAPSPLTNITAHNITLFEESEVVELTVRWEPPLFPNGVIQAYELRLGREEIPPTAEDFQGQFSYRTVIQVRKTKL